MGQLERLVLMAEDELTQYSTDARKIEKLRQKVALSVPLAEQRQIRATLSTEMPTDAISELIEKQRQTVALPFWGVAGLSLLLGISFLQPVDLLITIAAGYAALKIQQRGWKLQAKRLVIQTLDDIEARIQNPTQT
jgi:hypothetical protein